MIKSKLNACWIAQAFSLLSHPVPSYFNEKHDVVLHLHIRSQVWNHSNNYHIRTPCWVEDYRLANYFEIIISFGQPIECFEMRFFSQRGHIQCSWSCGSSKKMKHWFLHPSQYSSESSSESSAQLRDMKEDVFCHFWRCWQYFTWHSF